MLNLALFRGPAGQGQRLRLGLRLESRERAGHPEQVALRAHLDDLEAVIAPALAEHARGGLHSA